MHKPTTGFIFQCGGEEARRRKFQPPRGRAPQAQVAAGSPFGVAAGVRLALLGHHLDSCVRLLFWRCFLVGS